jgi:hypothetical protein
MDMPGSFARISTDECVLVVHAAATALILRIKIGHADRIEQCPTSWAKQKNTYARTEFLSV